MTVPPCKVHKGEKGSSKIWDLTVDELTEILFTWIYNQKNEFIESMYQCIQAQTASGYPVLIIRQDNAGENKTLEKRLQRVHWKLQVKMEYTASKYSTAECSSGYQIHLPSSQGQGSHACCCCA